MQNVAEINQTRTKEIQLVTGTFVVVFHVMAVWALFPSNWSWANLAAFLIVWWVAGSWGIGIGYHRLLTHGGFKAPKWLEYFFTICGTIGLQSGSLQWVTTHRIHHKFTEQPGDPHSPREGTFWSHMGWILQGTAQNQPIEMVQKYAPDLLKDKFHVFVSKYYVVTFVFVGILLYAIGGWSMVLWGIFLRQIFGWHSTWLVNSATHLWGTRRFETTDDSRNNGLIAALTFGEGWHNNHHANPRSAKHGLDWYEFDPNWLQIRFLEKIGLIKKVHAYDLKKEQQKAMMRQAA
jgi:fatty-acid desaturase